MVNVSWLGEQIVTHCGDGSRYGLRIHYSREAQPLETAGGIVQALPLLGPETFLVVNADIFTDYPFAWLREAAPGIAAGAARLVLVDNPAQHPAGDFSLRGATVLHAGTQTLTYAGIGLYHPQFFADCAAGKAPLLPLLKRAIDEQRLSGDHYRGAWTDVGTPERLQRLNESQTDEQAT